MKIRLINILRIIYISITAYTIFNQPTLIEKILVLPGFGITIGLLELFNVVEEG